MLQFKLNTCGISIIAVSLLTNPYRGLQQQHFSSVRLLQQQPTGATSLHSLLTISHVMPPRKTIKNTINKSSDDYIIVDGSTGENKGGNKVKAEAVAKLA